MRCFAGPAAFLSMAGLLTVGTAVAETGTPVAALPLVQQWTSFSDPEEAAFTLEVPQGWEVTGGTMRRNALQFRNWVNVLSPDRATTLAINDPTEWAYVVPTPLLAAAGFREGSVYSGGGGTTYIVAPYQTGEQFAVSWARRKLDRLCPEARLLASRGRPELTAQINAYAQAYGIKHDAGEASFTCIKDNQPMTAYVLASVVVIAGQAGAIWYAETMSGFLSPTPVAGVAAGVLSHMVRSVRVNPAWVARQTQTNKDVSEIAAQTNTAISNSIMREWENKGAVMDRVMEEGSRERLGIDIYADPATGTKYTVAAGHNFYWKNPSGTVVGTDTDTPPNGFGRLDRVPP